MRTNYHIQERHLAECVKQKVVSEEQVERILAVARTMAIADGEAAPDLRWVTAVHALSAIAAIGVPAIYILGQKLHEFAALELATASAMAALLYFATGFALRRVGWGRVPGSILVAGGVLFTWGIGAGLYAAAHHMGFGRFEEPWGSMSYAQMRALRTNAYLAGHLVALITAVALGLRTRISAIAASGGIAFAFIVMLLAEQHVLGLDAYFGEREASPYLIALGCLLIAGARFADKYWRGRHDGAFWLHSGGLMALGFAAMSRIHRVEAEGIFWTLAAVGLAWIGIRWDRRVYLFATAAGVLAFPAFAMSEAHAGDSVVTFALCASAVCVALGATWCRRHYSAAWSADVSRTLERTVWE